MEQSLFIEYIQQYFAKLALGVVERLNGTTNPVVYYHRRMLRKAFSFSGKWEALNADYSRIAADIVAMDSPLPLKKRDVLGKASGDIPKMGLELKLNETQLTELMTLAQLPNQEPTILAKIFADLPRVIEAVYETNEYMFLEGLSTGIASTPDDSTGQLIRLDYGYKAENLSGVEIDWDTTATAKPLDDIDRMIALATAKGSSIGTVKMDDATFKKLAATDQVRQQFAFSVGFVGGNIPIPDLASVNRVASGRGYTIEIIKRTVTFEKDGVRLVKTPWAAGQVILMPNDNAGVLAWANLAEMISPVAGVTYQTVDDFILTSKFRTNRPALSEWTNSQARVIPVISNVDSIYRLDTTTVNA